ncbi:MAG: hypothetical protein WKI49_01305 [Aquificaceae bacterium]
MPIKIYDRRYAMKDEHFFPKGAVAFFLSMVGIYALLWLSIYALLLMRGATQP